MSGNYGVLRTFLFALFTIAYSHSTLGGSCLVLAGPLFVSGVPSSFAASTELMDSYWFSGCFLREEELPRHT